MRYLLGQDFASLASQRTGKANPTFYDMKAQGFKALTKQDLLAESLYSMLSTCSFVLLCSVKEKFWLCSDPIGKLIQCPRDGRPGCALVDWVPKAERRRMTHFMSWTRFRSGNKFLCYMF